MSALLKPSCGFCLGAGLAMALILCIKNMSPNGNLPDQDLSYSVAELNTKATPDPAPFNPISSARAPSLLLGTSEIVQEAAPIPTSSPITGSRNTEELDSLMDNQVESEIALKQTHDETAHGVKASAEKSKLVRHPQLSKEALTDSGAEQQIKPLVSHGRPNQSSGIQRNPLFKANNISPQKLTDVRSTEQKKNTVESEEPADSESVIEFEEASLKDDPSQLTQILASPHQFANSPQSNQVGEERIYVRLNEAVAVRAVQHIEYGKTLARRGAKASAKQEFMAALSIIAQDFDSQIGSVDFSQALRRGSLALREAEAFVLGDSESQIGMNVSSLVESHQSGALARDEAFGWTPIQALQRYYGYAQAQLERAVGNNVVSAEALYCLGRLHTLLDPGGLVEGKLDRAKAMVYHRTSLSCDPRNYRSANELGVLLAEFGELDDSLLLLKRSLRINPTPKTWDNLAKLHERLNQPQLSELAKIEYRRALENQNTGMIQWIDSNRFNANAPPEGILAANPTAGVSSEKRPPANGSSRNSNADTEQKSLTDRVKSWF